MLASCGQIGKVRFVRKLIESSKVPESLTHFGIQKIFDNTCLASLRTIIDESKRVEDLFYDALVRIEFAKGRDFSGHDGGELGVPVPETSGAAIYCMPLGRYLSAEPIDVCVSSWRRVRETALPARATGKPPGPPARPA